MSTDQDARIQQHEVFLVRLQNFRDAAGMVLDAWPEAATHMYHDLDPASGYPPEFAASFEEIVEQIELWVEKIQFAVDNAKVLNRMRKERAAAPPPVWPYATGTVVKTLRDITISNGVEEVTVPAGTKGVVTWCGLKDYGVTLVDAPEAFRRFNGEPDPNDELFWYAGDPERGNPGADLIRI